VKAPNIAALKSSVFRFGVSRKKIFGKRLLKITNKHCSIVFLVFAFLTLNEFGVLLYSPSSLNFNEDFYEAF